MFISKKRHLAIIKEMFHYWSKEFDRMRRENVRLKAQLEAKASFEKTVLLTPEKMVLPTPLPAPVPAVERPQLVIVHLHSNRPLWTACGCFAVSNELFGHSRNMAVVHRFAPNRNYKTVGNESWCADCLD